MKEIILLPGEVAVKDIPSDVIDFLYAVASRSYHFKKIIRYLHRRQALHQYTISQITNFMNYPAYIDAAKYDFPKKSLQSGDLISIDKKMARILQHRFGMKYFFRNLEIVDVLQENGYGCKITFKFSDKILTDCHICGRALDCEISKACGVGPVCLKHIGLERPKKGEAHDILAQIMELAKTVGVLGPVWIPKVLANKITIEAPVANEVTQ